MERFREKVLGLSAAALAACLILDFAAALHTGLTGPRTAAALLGVDLVVVAAVWARVRLARMAEEERRDREILRAERPESALFPREEDLEPFSLSQARHRFERFVMPGVAPALAVLEGLFASGLWRALSQPPRPVSNPLAAGSWLAGQAFLLFLLGRYLLGVSRVAECRWLRGPAVYVGLTSYVSSGASAAAFLTATILPAADRIWAGVAIFVLAALGLEAVARTLAWAYARPPPGTVLSYETRLGAAVVDPSTWARGVAQTLDYQFGFEVSRTWIYRFLSRALGPALVLQALVLYGLTCLVFLGPEEEAVRERFGRPLAPPGGLWGPGFHAKGPWPFETIRRVPARKVLRLHLGAGEAEALWPPRAVLWTVPHYEAEDHFLVAVRDGPPDAVPVSLLALSLPVEYRITNVYAYAYRYAEPARLLRDVAYRALTREAAGRGVWEILGEGQEEFTRSLRERIQQDVDRLGLGVRIEFLGLAGVHPPVAVAEAFESVIGALEEKEAAVLAARAEAEGLLPRARGEAAERRAQAEGYAVRRVHTARVEAEAFVRRREVARVSPRVFRRDLFLTALRDALAGSRKYIVGVAPGREVITLDFEEKPVPDLWDLGPAPEGERVQ